MTLSRTTVSKRADAVRSALSRADTNHDGKLSKAEQAKAVALVTGAADTATREAFKQARLSSGYVSVAKAKKQVTTAERNALRADGNKNGVSAAERKKLTGPIARALTQGATGGTGSTGATQIGNIKVSSKMRKLAQNAVTVAKSMGGYRSQGLCATGVSRNILKTMGIKVWGNGNQIDNNLPRSKFKQLNISLKEALKIPGLVLTWERTSTRLGSKYGHTAVTLGNGKSSASDFIERNTLGAGGRSGFKVFMPIG